MMIMRYSSPGSSEFSKSFYKMHALGNDCIIIPEKQELWGCYSSEYISWLCDRKFGIGADQLILYEHSSEATSQVAVFNSSGTKAETCGNALRCLMLLIYKTAGVKELAINAPNRTYAASYLSPEEIAINMGTYKYNCLKQEELRFISELYSTSWSEHLGLIPENIGFIELSNPHLVIETKDYSKLNLDAARLLTIPGKYFTSGANISIIKFAGDGGISARVIERGAGETLACGSAACAIGAYYREFKSDSSSLQKEAEYAAEEALPEDILINFPGGRLKVEYIDRELNLRGPAKLVYRGELLDYGCN
jgi:diaminopimelate epimerase